MTPAARHAAPARRVAFYVREGRHRAVVAPVAASLGDRLPWTIHEDVDEVVAGAPDILVLVSLKNLRRFRLALPDTIIGSLRHGLIGKRGLERVGHRPLCRRLDFLSVGDQLTVDRYVAANARPTELWWTGYPQVDPLFRGDPPAAHGLPTDQPVVLYAPTWTEGLSSVPLLGDRVAELVRGDGPPLGIIIKPHPMIATTHPEWLAWWHAVAARDPRVVVVDDRADVTGYMLAADLMISDASSTIFEFLPLDRPMVLITSPAAVEDRSYDADDLPWRFRAVGEDVTDVAQLADAVARALARPEARARERRRVADLLFGRQRDGRNAERIADRIVDLAERMDRGVGPESFARVAERRRAARTTAGAGPVVPVSTDV